MAVEVSRSRRPRANVEKGPSVGAPFGPIQQLRAHEYVAEQIRRHIALRLIRPGESLPSERELASMFGVGRPTIQHAMRVLEADHLVEARRGRGGGTFVREPAEDSAARDELVARVLRQGDELEELLGWRQALEPVVAREAARARRRTGLTAMWRAIREMDEAPTDADYMRYDTELHIAIAAATRNTFMRKAIEEVRLGLNDALSLLPESDAWHRRLAREHEAIVSAIEARDDESASAAMALHVANSVQGVRAALMAIKRRLAS